MMGYRIFVLSLLYCTAVASDFGPIQTNWTLNEKTNVAYVSGSRINPFDYDFSARGIQVLDFLNKEIRSIAGPFENAAYTDLNLNIRNELLALRIADLDYNDMAALYAVNTETEEFIEIYLSNREFVANYVWSPDGNNIAFIIAEGFDAIDDKSRYEAPYRAKGVGIYSVGNSDVKIFDVPAYSLYWAAHDNNLYIDRKPFRENDIVTLDIGSGDVNPTIYKDLFISPSGDYYFLTVEEGTDTVIYSKDNVYQATLMRKDGYSFRNARWLDGDLLSFGGLSSTYSLYDVRAKAVVYHDDDRTITSNGGKRMIELPGYRPIAFGKRNLVIVSEIGFLLVDSESLEVKENLENTLFKHEGFCASFTKISCTVKKWAQRNERN
ncbi:hypothetical protein [Reinekea sp. G2M2-21]|uniref:hypothetical protein n=1 Tax=Reinekea sp. G2M2-21 TaxID=2788942 RepID=UPI0018A90B32|nr:hypothetical protein [Reinekea sp. G2M2-21]